MSLDRPRRVIYKGRKIDLALVPVTLADGSIVERELVLHRGAVALVPMVDNEHVCLVRNERYAVGKTLIEVPAGTIDEGETPEITAGRELIEETGYRASHITKLAEWYVSPGVLNERMYLFRCDGLTLGATSHQPDERLESLIVPWHDAVAMAYDGRIEDAKSIVAILLCERLRRAGGA